MNILFIANYDYANIFSEWCLAFEKYLLDNNIKNINLKYYCLKQEVKIKYEYNFPKCSINTEIYISNLPNYIIKNNFTSIFFEGEVYKYYDIITNISKLSNIKRNFNIFHTGSRYRRLSPVFNKLDNHPSITKIIYGSDLYRLAPNINVNKKCVILPIKYIETLYTKNDLINKYNNNNKLLILHCPSNRVSKGSDTIKEIVDRVLLNNNIQNYFEYKEISNVSNEEIMSIKKNSHIYIDQFNINVGGFGVSSMEALAVGNIVLSSMNNIPENVLHKNFPIINISSLELFEKILTNLLLKNKALILQEAINSYDYYYKEYSNAGISKKLLTCCI